MLIKGEDGLLSTKVKDARFYHPHVIIELYTTDCGGIICRYRKASPRIKVSCGYYSSIRSSMVQVVVIIFVNPSRQSHIHTGSRCAFGIK